MIVPMMSSGFTLISSGFTLMESHANHEIIPFKAPRNIRRFSKSNYIVA